VITSFVQYRQKEYICALLCACMLLTSCGTKKQPLEVSGVRSGIITVDRLSRTKDKVNVRQSAPLGVFSAEYLSNSARVNPVQGAIDAVSIQSLLSDVKQEGNSADGPLLQAFSSALEVDVADLLNRSSDREQALSTYSEALTNVAMRANDRLKELSAGVSELKTIAKERQNEQRAAEKALDAALKGKEFESLHDLQNTVSNTQLLSLEATSKAKQVSDIVNVLEKLLKIYGQKILAIQVNREALIAGIQVVDLPGTDELRLIRTSKQKPSDDPFAGAGL
jgi:hypothetical protein